MIMSVVLYVHFVKRSGRNVPQLSPLPRHQLQIPSQRGFALSCKARVRAHLLLLAPPHPRRFASSTVHFAAIARGRGRHPVLQLAVCPAEVRPRPVGHEFDAPVVRHALDQTPRSGVFVRVARLTPQAKLCVSAMSKRVSLVRCDTFLQSQRCRKNQRPHKVCRAAAGSEDFRIGRGSVTRREEARFRSGGGTGRKKNGVAPHRISKTMMGE